ncbi:MAG TPA: amidase [Mycobacteriales bacterium]|nr:amidase [Mycobacteriales bacterium]
MQSRVGQLEVASGESRQLRCAVTAALAASALGGLTFAEAAFDARYRPAIDAVVRETLDAAAGDDEARDELVDGDIVDQALHSMQTPVVPSARLVELAESGGPALSALVEIWQAVRRGERSREPATLELLAVQERLERLARPLNALVRTIPVPSRAPAGPLAGRAVAVKDIVAVRGVPTLCGSPAADPAPARDDALLVRRLREAGAEIVATTQCLEYAAGFAHPDVGNTRNPRDPAVTSGGSSGGSAAVVASGACSMAVGTDTGGSVRIPAAYCGTVGVKPTYRLIPTEGVFPLSPSLDHVGVLADSVSSAAALLAVLGDRPSLAGSATASAPTLTLGVLTAQFDDASVTPAARRAMSDALDALATAGIELRPVDPAWCTRLVELEETLVVIASYEGHLVHRDRDISRYAAGTRSLLAIGAEQRPQELELAHERACQLTAEIDQTLAGLDALVGPTVGYCAPAVDPAFGLDDKAESRFVGPYNLTGHPAVSLPIPVSVGQLPLGIQLAAPRGADAHLLTVAARVEDILGARAAADPVTPLTTEGRR